MRLRATGGFLALVSILAVSGLATAPAQARTPLVQGLQVTDLSDTTFAVVFTTTREQAAVIRYGTSPTHLTGTARDDRDLSGRTMVRSVVHRVTLSGLKGGTNYYFEPVVAGTAQGNSSGRPFQQATAPLQAPRIPIRIHGTVETSRQAVPPPGTVLLIGQWTNPGGGKSRLVSVLNDAPNRKQRAGTYDMVPTLLTANGTGPFEVDDGATFRVSAEADDHGRLVGGGPATGREGIHITIPALIKLRAPAGR
jgi:hypothetical protein